MVFLGLLMPRTAKNAIKKSMGKDERKKIFLSTFSAKTLAKVFD
jgi:hypothetical protein